MSPEQIFQIDGISYHYLLEGPPSSSSSPKLILLIHALMSSLEMYNSTILPLHAAGYSTLRFNHIGHSSTPSPSPPSSASPAITMDTLTHHIHHLVQHAITSGGGHGKLEAILGCSIGGVLALRYAMLYPQASSPRKFISIAAPGIKTPGKAKKLWPERVKLFEEDVRNGREELCLRTVQRWFPGDKPRDLRAREISLGHVRGCGLEGYRILAEAISDYDFEDEVVEGLKGREVLIVAGSEDGAIDVEELRRLAGRIEGAEFVLMEGAGHLPPLHLEGEFEGIMMRFLERGGEVE